MTMGWNIMETAPEDGTVVAGLGLYKWMPYSAKMNRKNLPPGRWVRWNQNHKCWIASLPPIGWQEASPEMVEAFTGAGDA